MKSKGWLKTLLVIFSAIILTTVGIGASDNFSAIKRSILGSALEDDSDGPCPAGMVAVLSPDGDFCIDEFENSPGESCPVKTPSSKNDTDMDLSDAGCYGSSREGGIPWTNISQDQARTACAKAGKRLPTADEWSRASIGTPDKESGWTPEDCQVSSNWESQPGPAGSAKSCVSSSGARDMIGNVWEWVDETVEDGIIDGKELPDSGYVASTGGKGLPGATTQSPDDTSYKGDYFWIKKSGIRGTAMGGYWDNDSKAGHYSAYLVSEPSFAGMGVGFRCVK